MFVNIMRPHALFFLSTLLALFLVVSCSGSDGLDGEEGSQGLKVLRARLVLKARLVKRVLTE